MPYDIFISYAHQGDNTSREAVAALVARLHAELESDFRRRFKRDLEIFFDKEDIKDFDHWQVRCHRALRDSRFFIACLSRTYLRSDACRWEWEEWCRHELEHGLVGQGAASLWFVKLEDLDAPEDAALLRRWKGDLLQRFHIQCHEWRHDDHGNILDAAARSELQQLTEHVAQRLRLLTLDRARRGNLPWPNANFVGREPELASLRAALLDAPEQSPAGIHGVGGMGKTALAQAFAYKESDAFPGGCWLLRCEGRDRLLTVFRNLVNDLEIELTDEEKLDDAKAVRRVFEVLRARGPTLFLLDNVDRPALLAQEQMQLVAGQPWARVLYTTRLAPDEFTQAGAVIRPLDLDRLPENQAVDLIRRYQPGQAFASPEHEAAAREIVRELSGLTLAVETAAVYLGQCDPRLLPKEQKQHAVDVRDYLNKLREDLKTGGSEGVMNQLREVTATLRPTLARLDAPARTVLQIASLLAPDGVALPWVRAIAGQSHPELAADAATGESDPWTQLIRGLIGMRLFQPTAEPRVVAIHRILQRVLETELSEGQKQLEIQLEEHVEARNALLEKETHWQVARWELLPLDALAHVWANKSHPSDVRLLCSIGQRWQALAEWTRAERAMRRALEISEHRYGSESQDTAACLSNLGLLLHKINRLDEAEPLTRLALAINERILGQNHPIVTVSLHNLAGLLAETNRVREAEPLARRALANDEGNFGPEHPRTALGLGNLAGILEETNRLPEAEQLMRRALTIDEKYYGTDHPDVARRLSNLARLLQEMNRRAEAEPLIRRAIAINERCFGSDHPNVAICLTILAALLHATNRLAEAEPLKRRALAIYEQSYGLCHTEVATSLNNLANLLMDTNRMLEAEPLFRRALTIDEKSYGMDHPKVAGRLNNLAELLRLTNRIGEAEQLIRRALAIDEKSFEPDHPSVANRLKNLASLLHENGRSTEAEPMMRRALAIEEKSFGSDHPEVAASLNNLAQLLLSTNRPSQAEPLMRRAVAIEERSFGSDHPSVALALNNLALMLQDTGRKVEAEALFSRQLKILIKASNENHREHPRLRRALMNYAALHSELGLAPRDLIQKLKTIDARLPSLFDQELAKLRE